MRKLLFAVALTLFSAEAFSQNSSAPSFPPPEHPATVAQIEQIMTLSHSAENIRLQMKASIADQEKNGPKYLTASFWNDFAAEVDKTNWLTFLTPVYQKYYSTEDATEIIRFYSTPAGQKVLAAAQPFLSEIMSKSTSLGRDIGRQVGEKHAAEIKERMQQTNSTGNAPQTPN